MAEQLRLECVRCQSTDTKFCYFNNHSMSQPRYFCKTCRRYWTHGGATRDVSIGGGVRRLNRGGGSSSGGPAAQGQGNSTVALNQNVAAAQGQNNPIGVNYQIHNLNFNGPHYAVLMDPNDTSGNVYWDPFLVPNNSNDIGGSTSGPSSTDPAT